MISREEIMLARICTAKLKEDDCALLLVKLNSEGELITQMLGDEKSTRILLSKLIFLDSLRSERRKQ